MDIYIDNMDIQDRDGKRLVLPVVARLCLLKAEFRLRRMVSKVIESLPHNSQLGQVRLLNSRVAIFARQCRNTQEANDVGDQNSCVDGLGRSIHALRKPHRPGNQYSIPGDHRHLLSINSDPTFYAHKNN